MERNVVAIYKKIKIVEDFYLYKFKEIATDVEYDYIENTVTYIKNGKKITVYEMEDPAFTVSDEKLCFSDYMEISVLEKLYDETDYDKLLNIYKDKIKSFIRYIYFDEEKDIVKVMNSSISEIKNAEPDTYFNDYILLSVSDYDTEVTFPIETIKSMLKQLEKKNMIL